MQICNLVHYSSNLVHSLDNMVQIVPKLGTFFRRTGDKFSKLLGTTLLEEPHRDLYPISPKQL